MLLGWLDQAWRINLHVLATSPQAAGLGTVQLLTTRFVPQISTALSTSLSTPHYDIQGMESLCSRMLSCRMSLQTADLVRMEGRAAQLETNLDGSHPPIYEPKLSLFTLNMPPTFRCACIMMIFNEALADFPQPVTAFAKTGGVGWELSGWQTPPSQKIIPARSIE